MGPVLYVREYRELDAQTETLEEPHKAVLNKNSRFALKHS